MQTFPNSDINVKHLDLKNQYCFCHEFIFKMNKRIDYFMISLNLQKLCNASRNYCKGVEKPGEKDAITQGYRVISQTDLT